MTVFYYYMILLLVQYAWMKIGFERGSMSCGPLFRD